MCFPLPPFQQCFFIPPYEWKSIAPEQGSCAPDSANAARHNCELGTIASGQSVRVRLVLAFTKRGTFDIKAGVQNTQFEATDPISANDTRTQTTTVRGAVLTVTKAGSADGTVAQQPDAGIHPIGTRVTLTATPASGAAFAGWGGACSGSNPTCVVTMDGDKSVVATFQPFSSCTSRPKVGVQVSATLDGGIRVTVTPGQGTLSQLRFGTPTRPLANAVVTVNLPSGPVTIRDSASVSLPPNADRAGFSVSPIRAGAFTVPLTVVDGCGEWVTFVGRGAGS